MQKAVDQVGVNLYFLISIHSDGIDKDLRVVKLKLTKCVLFFCAVK